MKESMQMQQQKKLAIIPQIIKATLPIATVCLIFGTGGMISVFSQESKNVKLISKPTKNDGIEAVNKTQLPPYTMIVEGESVVIKFHRTDSNIQFNDLSVKQKKCLTNGGGIGCVLPGYASGDEVEDTEPTQRLGIERGVSSMSLFVEKHWLILGLFVGFLGHFIGIFGRKN